VAHDEDGERFGAARALDADDRALLDFGLSVERRLDVLGVYVEAGGGDDGLLLPATEVDVPILVHLSEVARGEPAAFVERAGRAVAPVAGRDVRAAHENLAALAELQLLAGQNLPDRASPRL